MTRPFLAALLLLLQLVFAGAGSQLDAFMAAVQASRFAEAGRLCAALPSPQQQRRAAAQRVFPEYVSPSPFWVLHARSLSLSNALLSWAATGTVPEAEAAAGDDGDDASDAPALTLVDYLILSLPEHADIINLLACMVDKDPALARHPVQGPKLVYVAAARKHLRLLTLTLLGGAAPTYVEPVGAIGVPIPGARDDGSSGFVYGGTHAGEPGYSVLHAAAANKLLVMELTKYALQLTPGGKASAGDEALGAWLAAIVPTLGRHLPPALAGRVKASHAALAAARAAGNASSAAAPAQTILTSDVQALANGVSFLLVKVLLDAVGKVSPPPQQGQGQRPGHLAPLLARDALGRTALHIAASTGNVGVVGLLVSAVQAAGERLPAPHAATAAAALRAGSLAEAHAVWANNKERVARVDATTLLCAYVETRDVLGRTAASAAAQGGYTEAASLLARLGRECGSGAEAGEGEARKAAAASTPNAVNREDEEEDGGWGRPLSPAQAAAVSQPSTRAALLDALAHADTCDTEVLHDAASLPPDAIAAAVLDTVATRGQPLLLRGLASSWALRRAWTADALAARHGSLAFRIADIPYAKAFGRPASVSTLGTFIETVLRQRRPDNASVAGVDSEGADAAPASVAGRGYVFDSASVQASGSRAGAGGSQFLPPPAWQDDAALAALSRDVTLAPPAFAPRVRLFGAPIALAVDVLRAWRAAAAVPGKGVDGDDDDEEDDDVNSDGLAAFATACPRWAAAAVASPAGPAVSVEAALVAALTRTSEAWLRPYPPPKPQFFLGGPGTGAPVHFHKDAWNVVAYGAKRWYVFPPAASPYSTQHIADWVAAGGAGAASAASSRGAAPLQCTQAAGDVFIVPAGWGHGVLNLGATVGVAVEFSSATNL